MTKTFNQDFKLGILGGGQLGRMLIQSGIDFNFNFAVLDPDEHAPCKGLAEFHQGKLTDFDTVLKFGEQCDIITIEIENVNTQALKELVKKGKKVVYTKPYLDWIKLKSTPPTETLFISPDSEIWQMRYEDETKLPCIEYDYVVQYDSPKVERGKNYPKITLKKFLEWASHDVTDQLPKGEWANKF